MKNARKITFSWKNLLRLLLLVLCGGILGVNIYLTNANRVVGNQLPMPFGVGAAMVLSGSMEPTFSKGDLIIVREADTYQVGDIVVFQDGNSLTVHRIIALDGETVTTQGDANPSADAPRNSDQLKGTVLFWIPYAGSVVGFLKTPIGTICVIAAAIALVEIPRRREKQKDDEEKQKILEEIQRLKKDL